MDPCNLPEAEKTIQCKRGVPSCQNLNTQRKDHEFPVRPLSEISSTFRSGLWRKSQGSRASLHCCLAWLPLSNDSTVSSSPAGISFRWKPRQHNLDLPSR